MELDTTLLDTLLEGCKSPEDIIGKNGLLKQLTKGLMERALEGEMNAHLGYAKHSLKGKNSGNSRNGHSKKSLIADQGKFEINIPRDRNGDFEPLIIEKGQRRFTGFDDKILSMYALGMTVRDIQYHLKDIYQVDVSPAIISEVSEKVMEDVKEWRNRSLEPIYSVVYFDALVVKVRSDNHIVNKSAYVALGVNMDGEKDILGLWINQTEGAKFWLSVVSEIQNRGVKDILIACVDGLKGFPEAIEAVYPNTDVQVCIVHMIRNSFRYVVWKDSKEFMADLKKVYRAPSEESGYEALGKLSDKWRKKYPSVIRSWENNWPHLSVMFSYPKEIRKMIYTTNAIESFNASLRKVTKNKRVFPSDDAVFKQLYLAIKRKVRMWKGATREWAEKRNQFEILFSERIQNAFTQKN